MGRGAKRLEDRFGRLEIEPGRYLVAESGYLVAEARRRSRVETRSTCSMRVSTIRPADLYGATTVSVAPADGEMNRRFSRSSSAVPSASRATFLPKRKADSWPRPAGGHCVGDLVVIECAPTVVMSSNQPQAPRPEVLIQEGRADLVRHGKRLRDDRRRDSGTALEISCQSSAISFSHRARRR